MIGGSIKQGLMERLITLFAVTVIQSSNRYHAVSCLEARLVVTNDGPTILGSNTTFRATLSFLGQKDERLPTLHQEKMLYDYSWEQTICGMVQTVHMKQNLTCNYTQVYSCPEDEGRHSLKVTVRVWELIGYRRIAVNTSEFVITETINANLSISPGAFCNSSSGKESCTLVATNQSVDMNVNIYDPSDYFKGAVLMYDWVFGDGYTQVGLDEPLNSHKYTRYGNYSITVNITAIFYNNRKSLLGETTKKGTVTYRIQTMDAIRNLTIHGATDVEVGTKNRYEIVCNASLPLSLCWFVVEKSHPYPLTLSTTHPCKRVVLTNRTRLEVYPQFNDTRTYSVGVYAQNAVSFSQTYKNVKSISMVPQRVTGLTLGILVGIAFCLLCIAVLTSYVRKQANKHVEVANFDFQNSVRRKPSTSLLLQSGYESREDIPFAKDTNKNRML
ncbi:transmembrane protein 130-like [Asterias rubens]|uniref:transmembrane protein 130-like n=1 Tax=Asterias rubens TaxID=7604 RepID=UPI0014551DFF|nr:transmembrane protein 130-like [Asterias rubens]XP_033631068.1 transmembrane protein 130-like [Asterias rubens]